MHRQDSFNTLPPQRFEVVQPKNPTTIVQVIQPQPFGGSVITTSNTGRFTQ